LAKPVLTREDTRKLDADTIASGTPSIELMERAGERIAAFVESHVDELVGAEPRGASLKLLVLAGPGNNGGDGFVVARLLSASGWEPTVALCARPPRAGTDAATNLERWKRLHGGLMSRGECVELLRAGGLDYDLVLDAMFGTGLDRDLDGSYVELIGALNESGLPVVAVDTPSGLCADTGKVLGSAVLADATVTLGAAKPGLFVGNGPNHAGRIAIADIGLRDTDEAGIVPVGCVLDDECCEAWVPHRHPMTHKGELGHVLIVGGSAGKTGAVLLAARAALRSGAGLVTMAVPATLAATTDAALFEAMTVHLADDGHGQVAAPAWNGLVATLERYRAIVVGPGLGATDAAVPLVRGLVTTFRGPLVIDADALNVLAAEPRDALERMFRNRADAGAARAVLTPHPGEMGRLLGISSAAVQDDRLAACSGLAERLAATVVLKGAATLVCDGDRTGFNSSGNAGMASPGMGDVLSGLSGTLAAELPDSFAAAALAVYVHGLAGDMLSDRYGGPGFLAGDLADAIPAAFAALRTGTR